MKMLSASGRVVAFHEPDHLHVWGAGEPGMHPYLNDGHEDAAYRGMYEKIFSGRAYRAPRFSRGYAGHVARRLQCLLTGRRLLVKSVYSLHNTEWIARRFPVSVVILLRHPCAVVHSIHRRWPEARLKNPQEQEALIADHLRPYRDLFQNAAMPYEVLASRVGAYYKVVSEAARRHPEWIVLRHEDLCKNPMDEFQSLFTRLDLEGFDRTRSAIEASNRPKVKDEVQHVQRVATEEVDKWRKNLSEDEIRQVAEYYCPFANAWYGELCSGLAENGAAGSVAAAEGRRK